LVFPFRRVVGGIEYAVVHRSDDDWWQGIAGGGENDEKPLDAAKREAWEEAGIPSDLPFLKLDSMATIPVTAFSGFSWDTDVLVIPEYSFGVEVVDRALTLSGEHDEVRWLPYSEASSLLRWDSNKNALWELNHRLLR